MDKNDYDGPEDRNTLSGRALSLLIIAVACVVVLALFYNVIDLPFGGR